MKVPVTDVLGRGPLERKSRRKGQVTAPLTQDLGSAPAWPLLAPALALWERRKPGWMMHTSFQEEGASERSESQNINQMGCKIVLGHAS